MSFCVRKRLADITPPSICFALIGDDSFVSTRQFRGITSGLIVSTNQLFAVAEHIARTESPRVAPLITHNPPTPIFYN